MSREKLRKLGLDLPLLPTSTVGSFPKPDYLIEARAQAARNTITKSELDRLERKATEFWVGVQEELGLDVLVDGEQYRGDMVAYFAETMPGFAKGGLVRSYGNRYYHKPVMVGPVRWPGPMTVDWWRWTQSLTSRPVKGRNGVVAWNSPNPGVPSSSFRRSWCRAPTSAKTTKPPKNATSVVLAFRSRCTRPKSPSAMSVG